MAMNGILSASMREKGLDYKLNFGLTIAQIRDISKNYHPDTSLAETLWKESVRELKVLATMLYPIQEFTEETAGRWVIEIPNQEIREQICLNLFQHLYFATGLVKEWAQKNNTDIRTTAYWLLARLLLSKKEAVADTGLLPFVWEDCISQDTLLRNAALLALKHTGRQSKEEADKILNKISVYKDDVDLIKQEAYNSLEFEFDYFFNG